MRIVIPTSNNYTHICQPCVDMLAVNWMPYRKSDKATYRHHSYERMQAAYRVAEIINANK